jgi:hypothetical protein
MDALVDLERHGLVEVDSTGHYVLTTLGRLAGESGTEVESIVRLVDCLGPLTPEDITDPTLIAAAQTTAELDQVLFPMNRRSTQKEPQAWSSELLRQGVPSSVLRQMERFVLDAQQSTLRAKKAVACLLFISGQPMNEVEATLTQFGGAFGGAAGPVRSAAARTCDLLGPAARVSEILHPGLDLNQRVGRLAIRLTLGVPAAAVDLAREVSADLLRGDYCRLARAGLCEPDAVEAANDGALLACLDGDQRKCALVRKATASVAQRRRRAAVASSPILEPYEG